MGPGAAIGCSVRHGGQKKKAKEIWYVRMSHNVSQAKPNSINIGSFCKEKRLLSMSLDDHTSPRVALPSWHPRRLAAPPGLRGLFFRKERGRLVVVQNKRERKKGTNCFAFSIWGGGGGLGGGGQHGLWCMRHSFIGHNNEKILQKWIGH